MSEMWFNQLGFQSDPYFPHEPWVTPLGKIVWNRDDLDITKEKMMDFIHEINDEYNSSILIYGPWRSGKSWLARYIQKEFSSNEEILFITIIIDEEDPSSTAFYQEFITRILESNFLDKISATLDDPISYENWRYIFDSQDLSRVIHNIRTKTHYELSLNWLLGKKLNSSDMQKISVNSSLDSLFNKTETIKMLIKKIQEYYNSLIVCIDQIEAAKGRNAKFLSDLIRDLNSSFYEKFGLILVATMENINDWYLMGFSEALLERIRYHCIMDLIKPEYLSTFIEIQQQNHRISSWSRSQLFPFNHESILFLVENMKSDKRYPRYILFNCGVMAKKYASTESEERETEISKDFIAENIRYIEWRLEIKGQTRLTL